jgi:glyoxylase-like metal-dependent hydrolase (beta-lactamase superfamily II)
MKVATFQLGPLDTNCHVASVDGRAIAVDPGGDPAEVLEYLKENDLALDCILVTHLHFDHIYGCAALSRATGAEIRTPTADEELMQTEIGTGGFMGLPAVEPFERVGIVPGEFEVMGQPCRALHTPGHTRGSLSFYFPESERLFSGDVLFYRSIGRSDLPGGDQDVLERSIREKIFSLPETTKVHPGHMIDTSVGDEKAHNPYVRA